MRVRITNFTPHPIRHRTLSVCSNKGLPSSSSNHLSTYCQVPSSRTILMCSRHAITICCVRLLCSISGYKGLHKAGQRHDVDMSTCGFIKDANTSLCTKVPAVQYHVTPQQWDRLHRTGCQKWNMYSHRHVCSQR